MSELLTRRLELNDIAELVRRSGSYVENNSYARPTGAGFKPWARSGFRNAASIKDEINGASGETPSGEEPSGTDTAANELSDADTGAVEQAAAEAAHAAPEPFVPPMAPQPSGPSPEDIIAEIEQAREDGRKFGYEMGLNAARQELHEAIELIRTMERDFLASTEAALQDNTSVIARHVRRLAQELAGTVFAEMPDAFITRIKAASEMFTRNGADFSLSMNPEDLKVLANALKGDPLFGTIKIVEDPDLAQSAFRLIARDLELEDTPRIEDVAE